MDAQRENFFLIRSKTGTPRRFSPPGTGPGTWCNWPQAAYFEPAPDNPWHIKEVSYLFDILYFFPPFPTDHGHRYRISGPRSQYLKSASPAWADPAGHAECNVFHNNYNKLCINKRCMHVPPEGSRVRPGATAEKN